ncbi:Iqca1l [Symbiodinium natans]|uniref:Iqca1l protein n=1 Tax=Symbiodinium natans TaxID=878477 RepID=A0A812RAJ3_9DINO|nr:Iqca1l [Symbiodinium natans]
MSRDGIVNRALKIICEPISALDVASATKKKKGGDSATAPSRIKKDLQAAINQVKRFDEANEQDRILFIGSTSRPFAEGVDTQGLKDSFDEKVWVSFPEYGSRVVLWQQFMEEHGVTVDTSKLNISTLARVSEGYPAGSIKQTIDRVLTARRVQQLKNRPLKVQEFIGPLSRTSFCWKEELDQFREFDHLVTGEKAREEAKNAPPEAARVEKFRTDSCPHDNTQANNFCQPPSRTKQNAAHYPGSQIMVDEEEAQLYRAWEYMENPLAEHSDDLENGLHTGSPVMKFDSICMSFVMAYRGG